MGFGSMRVAEFLDQLASVEPVPGGGSAAAIAGALSCALSSMVCRLTLGKAKFKGVETELEATLQRAERLRTALLQLADEDAAAYDRVAKALKLPKKSEEEKAARAEALAVALEKATDVPFQVAQLSMEALEIAAKVAEKGNPSAVSDAGVAALLAHAAAQGAYYNVQINLAMLPDEGQARGVREVMATDLQRAAELRHLALEAVGQKLGKE